MHKIIAFVQKITLYFILVATIGAVPMTVFADEAAPAEATSETKPVYTYNEETGKWDSDKWVYDPVSGTYVPYVAPAPAPTPEPVTSDSTATADTTNNTATDIDNTVDAQATTGDATVQGNTTASNATSGNALSSATVVNNVNSTSALSGTAPVTFSSDIYGDVYGDIELAPELLKALAATSAQGGSADTLNYTVTNQTNVTNDLILGATSGDASVLDNTTAGNATSGNAAAIANVLNIVNSVIAANQSFIGTINIHGNLDGDILLSRDGSLSTIASNAVSAPLSPGNLTVNQNDLTTILNNVDLQAQSGNAVVAQNTTAGSATTGSAETNLVILNLAGQNVVAKNSLLVFVNVLGKWVGIIVDAPTGATAAVLGDGATSQMVAVAGNTQVNTSNETTLTNNISLSAQTGDATVAGNTTAGDATSGNAKAGATILNMANSAFSVSDWFGVLFINVLGSWMGSFGVDTENGGKAGTTLVAPPSGSTATPLETAAPQAPAQVFRFLGRTSSPQQSSSGESATAATESDTTDNSSPAAAVLASTDTSSTPPSDSGSGSASSSVPTVSLPLAVTMLGGLLAVTVGVVRLIGGLRARFA